MEIEGGKNTLKFFCDYWSIIKVLPVLVETIPNPKTSRILANIRRFRTMSIRNRRERGKLILHDLFYDQPKNYKSFPADTFSREAGTHINVVIFTIKLYPRDFTLLLPRSGC